MSIVQKRVGASNIGSLIVASVFVIIGVVTLYDTFSYSDVDSKVFPRAAAILLVVTSLLSILLGLLKPEADEGFGDGQWWRRVLLVMVMILACLLMPKIGFLVASAVAFAGALISAMHGEWHWRKGIIYVLSGCVIVGGFYGLFRFGLNVPLP